ALHALDPRSGRATYASARHLPSLLLTRSGDVQPLSSTGAPLGLLSPGLPYDATSVVVEVGDVMVLCSDGVPDAQNVQGEEFGEESLLEIVHAFRHEPAAALVEKIFSAIDDFAGEAPQFDDITLMVLRRLS
ncbi:MAG: PP2C family protein-serine/threonine phosphatase, partial [Acidimicrobiia bacterium]